MIANIRLTIDLDAVVANWRQIRDYIAPAECAAVVKANAYGLGAPEIVAALYQAGCRAFYVAYVAEGIALRDHIPTAAIHVLNGFAPGEEQDGFAAGLIPVISTLPDLTRIRQSQSGEIAIALHVDTGLNRLGLTPEEVTWLKDNTHFLADTRVAMLMSHLASANSDMAMNEKQLARFAPLVEAIPAERVSLIASDGVYLDKRFHFDQARTGASLYGINPRPGKPNPMRPVVTLEAAILQIRDIALGESIGYETTFTASSRMRVATLSIGYADGIPRALSNKGQAFAAGQYLPYLGRVSMDVLTVDVSALPADALKPGDYVEIIGPNCPVDKVAEAAGTIGYEILTGLGRRARPVYVKST